MPLSSHRIDSHSSHRETSIIRARSTQKKRSIDSLNETDNACGAWAVESAANRFYRILHQMQAEDIVALKCRCVSCMHRGEARPPIPAVVDQEGKPHQCRIGEIISIQVLRQREFESRIWPSETVAKTDTLMTYNSDSTKPKNTFMNQLTRRGFKWKKDRSTLYPSYYEWSRQVADRQRDNVLSPNKAKAKKPRCSESDAIGRPPPIDPHIGEAAAQLPVGMLMPAAGLEAPPPREGLEATAMIDADSSSVGGDSGNVRKDGEDHVRNEGGAALLCAEGQRKNVRKAARLRTEGAAAAASVAERRRTASSTQARPSAAPRDPGGSDGGEGPSEGADRGPPVRARGKRRATRASYTASLLRPAADGALVGRLLGCVLDDGPQDDGPQDDGPQDDGPHDGDVRPGWEGYGAVWALPGGRRGVSLLGGLEGGARVRMSLLDGQDEGAEALWRSSCWSLSGGDAESARFYGPH